MTAPGARVVAQGCRYLGDGVTRTWSRWSGGRHEWTWEDTRLVYLISLGGGTYGSAELVGSGVGGPPRGVKMVDVAPRERVDRDAPG
jgi:hypothetical protein